MVVMKRVESGQRPDLKRVMDAQLREMIEACWSAETESRLSFALCQARLADLSAIHPVLLSDAREVEDRAFKGGD